MRKYSAMFTLRTVLAMSVALTACTAPGQASPHPLILVSMDGFRYDYLNWYREETAFLRSLMSRGVHVEQMQPAFTTQTFPNHWTVVTGLYQESHGIISNSMYDPVFNESFNKETWEERWWDASLPIWITARKQGLKSATFFWPGSEVQFQGMRPNYYYEYNGSIPFETRVKQVLDWVTKKGVSMATLYLNEPDTSGHRHGPNSTQVSDAVRKVDKTIRSLFDGLQERGVQDKVNVLIVSDHGMSAADRTVTIDFTEVADDLVQTITDQGALMGIHANPGKTEMLLDFLQNETDTWKLPVQVYTKETLPARFHYANNRRTPDVLVLSDQGVVVFAKGDNKSDLGNHGYDNTFSDMQVPLFGVGPGFQRNVKLKNGFRQVDVYGLACRLLGIEPQPNNGSSELFPIMLNGAATSGSGLAYWLSYFGLYFVANILNRLGLD